MSYIIKGKEIYTENKIIKDGNILISNGIIKGFNVDEKHHEIIDLTEYKIIPGLIDIHNHGAVNCDVMDSTYNSLNQISKYKLSNGVTSFLAGTVTSPLDKIKNAIINIEKSMEKGLDGAKLLGSYIEGPYITKKYKGAHPEDCIRELDLEEINELIDLSNNTIKIITIAPEKLNSSNIIKKLVNKNIIVSLGHSDATYEQTLKAIENGAKLAVHTYNGMRGLHHREPGMLGAILNNDNIDAELICDGVHVSFPAIQILIRCKNTNNIILITDGMMACGLEDGNYKIGELDVNVENSIARIDNGALAGSTLRLIDAVKNMTEKVGVPFENSLKMATLNPAKKLGLDKEIGSLDIGKVADIIAIDDEYNTVKVIKDGKL